MKKKFSLFIIGIFVLMSIFFFACEEDEEEEDPLVITEPATMQERVEQFEYDLNNDSDRDAIYRNLHSTIEAAWRDEEAWDNTTFTYDYEPFTFSNLDDSGNPITGDFTNDVFTNTSLSIYFELDDDSWMISRVDVNSATVID